MKKTAITGLICSMAFYTSAQVLPKINADEYDILNGNVKSIEEKDYSIKTSGTSFYSSYNYTFNSGNKMTESKYTSTGSLLSAVDRAYTYDSKNRLIQETEYDDLFGNLQVTYTYEKDNVIAVKEFSDDAIWGYSNDIYYSYDKKGHVLTERKVENDKVTSTTTFTWKKDLLIKKEISYTEGSSSIYTYEYNNNGKLTRQTSKTGTGKEYVNSYTYNSKGLRATYTNDYGDVSKYEYLNFDSKGNWIRRKTYSINKNGTETPSSYVYRSISYQDGTTNSSYSYISGDNKPNIGNVELGKATFLRKGGSDFILTIPGFIGNKDATVVYLAAESDHVIYYEAVTNATFIFENFRDMDSGATAKAKFLGNEDIAYWYKKDSSYWLYYQGKTVSGNSSFWVGNDLVIYSPSMNRTFNLKDYKTKPHGYLHKSEEITNNNNTFFYHYNKTYWLYIKGESIDFKHAIIFFYVNDDAYAFDSTDGITYKMTNYKKLKDNELGNSEVVSRTGGTFVYKSTLQGNYYLIVNGNYVNTQKAADYTPDNSGALLITVIETGEKYLVYNFKNAAINKLLPAKKID